MANFGEKAWFKQMRKLRRRIKNKFVPPKTRGMIYGKGHGGSSGKYSINDKREYYRKEYLKSDHWKQLRKEKLAKNPFCENLNCSGKCKQVDLHHLVYKNLFDVTIEDLKTLCRECHKQEHERIKNIPKIEDEVHKENKKEDIYIDLKSVSADDIKRKLGLIL